MSSELDHIQPGGIVGPYRIMRGFKGRGGMARVFEVEVREKYRQPNLPRRLALKVAKEEYQEALVAESDFRRTFAGAFVTAGITAGGWGIRNYVMTAAPTLGRNPPPIVETSTRTPTAVQTTPTPTVSPTAAQYVPTSTSTPTLMQTNTARPITPAPGG